MAINCSHTRPPVNMPGYEDGRPSWTPPTVLSSDPNEQARQIIRALQAVYGELKKLGRRRVVVPLIDATMQLREGQIVQGVADGNVLIMPQPTGKGGIGQVDILIDAVKNPVTVVHPNGSVETLTQPGLYEYRLGSTDVSWATTPGITGTPSTSGTQGPPGFAFDGQDGQDGAQGLPGVAGANGSPGIQGPPGFAFDGQDGIDGQDGLPGAKGDTGPQGPLGFPGQDGQDGQDGAQGAPGSPGATGTTGATGPAGADAVAALIPLLTALSDEPEVIFFPPSSSAGAGTTGATGATGSAGAQGPPGFAFDGEQGPEGQQGIQGNTGPTGPAGVGIQGAPGPLFFNPEVVIDDPQFIPPPLNVDLVPGRLITATRYTTGTAATHTFNALTRQYIVWVKAADGGGGGAATSAAGQATAGAEGGKGAWFRGLCTAVPASRTVTYTVGASGTAGNNTGTDGGDGGNSQWDTLIVQGGKKGIGSANALFGALSTNAAAIIGPGGAAGITITGALPTGFSILESATGCSGESGYVFDGIVGWGGGGNTSTASLANGTGQGGLSLNATANGAGSTGDIGRIVVWELT